MAARTAAELGYLRDDHPHITQLFLSIYKAPAIYVGQVTGSPARGARQITVSDVSGDISTLIAGHTLLVGTSIGDDDVSRRRFRSRSGQVLTVDENSVIWAAGQYITAIRFWELWPVFPYIESTSPYTFYKDRDIVYTDQNEEPDPIAVMDCHRAKFKDSASVTFTLDASESQPIAPGATITSWLWESIDGTIADSSAQSTTITYNSTYPDGTWVYLTVTDSNGKSHTTRRVLWVHERDGANAPNRNFEFSNPLLRNWRTGGASVGITVYDDALITDIQDRTLIILWQDAYYDGTARTIGEHNDVWFAGYIVRESIVKNRAAGSVTFEAVTVEALLAEKLGFSISLTDSNNPTKWWQYNNLTVPRAIHHLWHWHSTLLDIADVIIESNSTRLPAVDDFTQGNLYEAADTFGSQHGIFFHVCCSSNGRVYVETDVQMLNDAGRAAKTTVMEITEQDRRDEDDLTLVRQPVPRVAFAMLSGVTYDGTTTTPIIAKAPGEVPLTDGAAEISLERQVLASQTDANERVGRSLAIANAALSDGRWKCAGNYSFVDVVPQQWYTVTLVSSDTKRGLTLTNYKMVPRQLSFQYDIENGVVLPDVVLEPEANGDDGIAGQFPTTVPDTYPDPVEPETLFSGRLMGFDNQQGCYVRGSWAERNGALGGSAIQDQHAGLDPWWFTSSKQATFDPASAILWKCDVGAIYRTTDQGVTWTNMTPGTDPPNDAGDTPAPTATDVTYIWYEGDIYTNQQHIFGVRWQNGSGTWRSWLLKTTDDGSTWSWQSLGSGDPSLLVTQGSTGVATNGTNVSVCHMTGNKYLCAAQDDIGAVIALYEYDPDSDTVTELDVHAPAGLNYGETDIIMLTATKAVVVYSQNVSGSQIYVQVIDVNLDTISVGTPLLCLPHASTNYWDTHAAVIENSTTLWVFGSYSGNTICVAQEVNISGTVATNVGSQEVITSSAYYGKLSAEVIDATTALLSFYDASNSNRPTAIKVTFSPFATTAAVQLSTDAVYTSIVATQKRVAKAGTDLMVVIYVDTSYHLKAIAVDTSSTPNPGTAATIHGSFNADGISACYLSTNVVMVACYRYPTSEADYLNVLTLSGTTISVGDDIAINSADRSTTTTCVKLDNATVMVGGESNGLRSNVLSTIGGPAQLLGLSISGAGNKIFVTYNASDITYFVVHSMSSLTEEAAYSLGAATAAEVASNTYIARPYAPIDGSDSNCYIYGRMNNPAGLGLQHVVFTDDAGTTLYVVEEDWGADHCGAFFIDVKGRIYGVRNGTNELHGGILRLSYKIGLPWQVHPGAIYVTSDGYVVIGGKNAAGIAKIMYTRRPYSGWTNVTEDFPLSGGVTKLLVVK